MITQIYLVSGVYKLPVIDQFEEPKNTADLGLIKDATNPKDKLARRRTELLVEIYRGQGGHVEVAATNDTTCEGVQTARYCGYPVLLVRHSLYYLNPLLRERY